VELVGIDDQFIRKVVIGVCLKNCIFVTHEWFNQKMGLFNPAVSNLGEFLHTNKKGVNRA